MVGSHNGKIYLFDFKGNELRRVKAHAASVSDLSIDRASEYLASSSIDGQMYLAAWANGREGRCTSLGSKGQSNY